MFRKARMKLDGYFNSHPHEEDDLAGNGGIHNELYFNSHPHEEDDSPGYGQKGVGWIFQLTSSRRG